MISNPIRFSHLVGIGLLVTATGAASAAPCGMRGPMHGYGHGPAYAPPPWHHGGYAMPRHAYPKAYGYAAAPSAMYKRAAPPQASAEEAQAHSAAPAEAVESAEISIANMRFDSPTVTIKPGGTVTWRNSGPMPHTVTANNGSYASPQLASGQTYSRTFDEPGTYRYYCSLHPSMQGTVVVSEG